MVGVLIGAVAVLIVVVVMFMYWELSSSHSVVINKKERFLHVLQVRCSYAPQLAAIMSGHVRFESDLNREVKDLVKQSKTLHKQSTLADMRRVYDGMNSVIDMADAVVKEYPLLKDKTFLRIREEISANDQKLSFAKFEFNEQVARYNRKTDNPFIHLVASLFNFRKESGIDAVQ